ncbi:hypothetical protein [Bacteroides sp. L008]|uniref:hypothetical protein n=1 Tax=Bacteroides sp. L008 TaxID=3162404 RepID=UPI0034664F6E
MIKRLISYIIIQLKYWNKLKFPISARVSVKSHFEGANYIYGKCFFSGTMGYGSYVASSSYIIGKVGRFTSIAQEVKCVGGIPARILRYRYDEETINFLLSIHWWGNDKEWFSKHWELLSDIDKLKAYYVSSK